MDSITDNMKAEAALIDEINAGDVEGFRELVVRYEKPLLRFLSTFSLPSQAIQEMAQETFLRAYQNLPNYSPARGASFSTWLFTIAKNQALNELARARTKKEVFVEAGETVSGHSVLETLEGNERFLQTRLALNLLPEPFGTALKLSYIKELSLQEIATIERCSVGTVKSRVHRAKHLLREILLRNAGGKNDI